MLLTSEGFLPLTI